MKEQRPSDAGADDRIERGHPGPPEMEEPGPLPGEVPMWGPVEYDHVTGDPLLPDNLENPTRRRHPTILSEEGQEEAPANELPRGENA